MLARRTKMKPKGFNEAPIHESGKSRLQSGFGHGGARFNEAPIHESGKCTLFVGRLLNRYRFNEAPIHESGKS